MDIKNIMQAKEVLDDIVDTTPLIDASVICDNLWIKAESLQKTGSFKIRGATYKISKLSKQEKNNGIICASAGNHAQGVALACKKWGISGIVVMPIIAPISKIEATKSYGVEVLLYGDTFQEAYEHALKLAEEYNRSFIEPYNDDDIIAGQGTIGLEIIEKMMDVEQVFVPIGGGGLASGVACAIKSLLPSCKVIGVQTQNASSMKKSFDQKMVVSSSANTMADGIAVSCVGDKTLNYCLKYLDDVILVSDEEIAATMLILLEKLKLVSEGAGAAAICAALYHNCNKSLKSVAILSGGNVDVNYLSQIINLGLMKTGRQFRATFEITDKPGNLQKLIDIFSLFNANIVSIEHLRDSKNILHHLCSVSVVLEMRDSRHKNDLIKYLEDENYKIIKYRDEWIVKEY
ncbi:MAG: threonine ammonia-lyase [Anaerorhabdus sp.]